MRTVGIIAAVWCVLSVITGIAWASTIGRYGWDEDE